MSFDWIQSFKKGLPGWKERMRRAGIKSSYTMVAASALWPVVSAAQAGNSSAGAALLGVAGNVGANLLANLLQNCRDETDGARRLAALPKEDPLRTHLDTVLEHLGAFAAARSALPEADRDWFVQTLRTELTELGNLPRFEAHLTGEGNVAIQGQADKVVVTTGFQSPVTYIEHLVISPGEGQVDTASRDEYLRWVIGECAPLKLKAINQGAVSPGIRPLGLTSVYVDLNLELRLPAGQSLAEHLEAQRKQALDPKCEGRLEPTQERAVETRLVPALEALGLHRQLVLLGAPGSGKSTLVAYVALSLAEAAAGQMESLSRLGQWWRGGALLPVRVILRHFAATLPTDLPEGHARHLWDFLEADLLKRGLTPDAARVPRRVAAQTGALFLLDGLDEVREEATRARMLEAVAEFANTAGPGCRFLLTARPYAWEEFQDPRSAPPSSTPAQLAEMHTAYRLADFEPEQSQTFVSRWYAAIRLAGWPVSEPERKGEELCQAVEQAELASLARNPLLLTLMATLHSNRAKLPEDRADLYHEVVELLLERWNQQIGADRGLLDALAIPTLTLGHLRKVIQTLAFEAHAAHAGQEGLADLPEGTLLAGLRPLLAHDTGKAALTLRYIEERAGLLLGQGERAGQRHYTFPHRTFQEYLAACHLAGRNDFCKRACTLARENPAHWREVLTLAARRAEADRGVPVADALVHCLSFSDWAKTHSPLESDWRTAVLAAEQMLEIGLAAVEADENHRVVRDRVAGWLAALLEQGGLPAKDRARAGIVLGKLGDPRPGVGLKEGLPDLAWLEIPPGRFAMGGQGGYQAGEGFPCGLIRQPYRLSRYPITVAQYEVFIHEGGYEPRGEGFWTKAGWQWREAQKIVGPETYEAAFQTPNHPRVGVSWFEAHAFCQWLTVRLRAAGRISSQDSVCLPSEAEWERAARGAQGRTYPWGDDEADIAQRCNMGRTGVGHTSAVGVFPKGDAECGAADLAGNVWEWCRTIYRAYGPDYEAKVSDAPEAEGARVLRGGSWIVGSPDGLRCSLRDVVDPVTRGSNVGFRCVLVSGSGR